MKYKIGDRFVPKPDARSHLTGIGGAVIVGKDDWNNFILKWDEIKEPIEGWSAQSITEYLMPDRKYKNMKTIKKYLGIKD